MANEESAHPIREESAPKPADVGDSFQLPDQDTISEWFSNDHLDRLRRIFSLRSDHDEYGKYSVYEVYNKSKDLL